MKKTFARLSCLALLIAVLVGCAPKNNAPSTGTDVVSPSETPAAPSSPGVVAGDFTFSRETYTDDLSQIEYIEVSGSEGTDTLLLGLNNTLWAYASSDVPEGALGGDTPFLTTTSEYALVCDRYLSVRIERSLMYPGAAYPTATVVAVNFDLATFQFLDSPSLLAIDDALRDAIVSGVFTQTYPAAIDGAPAIFADEFFDNIAADNDLCAVYLTDTGIALALNERLHAEGDYWVFEATYERAHDLLAPSFQSLLDNYV
jgi:hypothetical protein